MASGQPDTPVPTEPDPPLGSWRLTYGLVLLSAAVCIALLWWLTRYARPGEAG